MVSLLVVLIPNQFGSFMGEFLIFITMYLQFLLSSVSLVFWTGLLPDFAMLRDRAVTLLIKEFIL
jgi:molybdopterin-containing oxidoreductase family membrane subunit